MMSQALNRRRTAPRRHPTNGMSICENRPTLAREQGLHPDAWTDRLQWESPRQRTSSLPKRAGVTVYQIAESPTRHGRTGPHQPVRLIMSLYFNSNYQRGIFKGLSSKFEQ